MAHLGHKGLRAVVKQVLQVYKKPENRIKANKCKSQSEGSKACPGYPEDLTEDWGGITDVAEVFGACKSFHKQF